MTNKMRFSPDQRFEILENIRPQLLRIDSAHEAAWIIDYVQKQESNFSRGLKKCQDIVARRENHEPLAYIFGEWSFRTYDFHVGPGILIPRPETEELVEAALMSLENSFSTSSIALDQSLVIADLGAGSGCLGLTLACDLLKDVETETGRSEDISKNYTLHLVERSAEALPILKRNVERMRPHLKNTKVKIFEGSWEDWPVEECDVLLSNPPYLTETEFLETEASVKNFEPKSALVPLTIENDPAAYSPYQEISKIGLACLKPGAWLWFELGQTQPTWIQPYVATLGGYNDLRMMKDMSAKYRFFCARKI